MMENNFYTDNVEITEEDLARLLELHYLSRSDYGGDGLRCPPAALII